MAEILAQPRFSATDQALIERAFQTAQKAHEGQKRLSGDAFISHPVAVAKFVADMGLDAPAVAASLLHDTLEDTKLTKEDIKKQFGSDVAFLVDGVTKLKTIRFSIQDEDGGAQLESIKKMFLAMAEDLRVVLIKLADRHHNMATLKYKDSEAQKRIAMETLEIYAPIADRLGMGGLKGVLEDMAFPFAYPLEYRMFTGHAQKDYREPLAYLKRVKPIIAKLLKDAGITVSDIHARAKHLWSLYQKMQRYGMTDAKKIFDLVALRVIVPDIKSCYGTLGAIHAVYKPLAGRIKDFIAVPKPNGYRSLHTTIFCEDGRIVEIQIRTPDMHEHAENGIAAHWAYAESGKLDSFAAKQREIVWVSELKAALRDINTDKKFRDIKIDFFKNHIFAFTPKGLIKDLPEGATPVDLAYAIHTDLGHQTSGAKVNGKIAPLDSELKNGDVVEIIKSKKSKPSMDWLRTAKTAHARQSINAWFKNNDPHRIIANGKVLLNRELKLFNASFEKLGRQTMNTLLAAFSAKTPDALLTRISVGDVDAADMARMLFGTKKPAPRRAKKESEPQREKPPSTSDHHRVIIGNQKGLLYRLGHCCDPAPEQTIQGYVTRSRGVTVHLASCSTIKNAVRERLLPASWK